MIEDEEETTYYECAAPTPLDAFCPAVYLPVCDEYNVTHPNECELCRYSDFFTEGECESEL